MKKFLFLLFALPLVLVSCNPDEDDNELSGCMDPDAVNFNTEATVDDGSCDGPLECGGLSAVTYGGYTYDLVAIGDQCWFAENLRTEHYANGDAIAGELNDEMWENAHLTNSGAQAIYENNSSHLATYGRLYNWYAVDDARGLCPSGWHVPTDGEYMTLEMELGMPESKVNTEGTRGTNQGFQMKAAYGWVEGDGSNSSGFSALPVGYRSLSEGFGALGYYCYFWTTSGSKWWDGWRGIYRRLVWYDDRVERDYDHAGKGFSVRCVRD